PALGQGTFIVDQQSTTHGPLSEYSQDIRTNQPLGQSFTPALSSVGFVRLFVWDLAPVPASPATISMNLRSDSITGPILASTVPVVLDPSFRNVLDFVFPSPVSVVPGTTYYFQPECQSSDAWNSVIDFYNYAGGVGYALGLPRPPLSFWFQKGIIVPEPSTPLILLVGGIFLTFGRRPKYRMHALCKHGSTSAV